MVWSNGGVNHLLLLNKSRMCVIAEPLGNHNCTVAAVIIALAYCSGALRYDAMMHSDVVTSAESRAGLLLRLHEGDALIRCSVLL